MVEKISPLGRGVNALFSKIKSNSFATLEINQIFPNPFQPRTNFNESIIVLPVTKIDDFFTPSFNKFFLLFSVGEK